MGILEFTEDLRFKNEVALEVVTLAGSDRRLVRGRLAGENADPGILTVFGNAVVELELLLFAAKFAGRLGAEII